MAAKQGEVWLADLGLAAKTRPVIILSQEDPQAPRALVTYIPLTTQYRGSRYEVELGKLRFLKEASVANIQGIGSIPRSSLTEKTWLNPCRDFKQNQTSSAFRIGSVIEQKKL